MDEIFRWETLRQGDRALLRPGGRLVPGYTWKVELTNGTPIEVWRSDDGTEYFCHGLTFGGKLAPGGAVSPYGGMAVTAIVTAFFVPVNAADARPGDMIVWHDAVRRSTPHSAVLLAPVTVPETLALDDGSRLLSKNGFAPEGETTLYDLQRLYGMTYTILRRRDVC